MKSRIGPLILLVIIGCRAVAAQQPAPQAAPPQPQPITATVPSTGFSGLDHYRASRINVYMNDFAELARYRAANAALPSPAAGENRVVFFGDSITDIWHLDESFPGKLYVNRGIGGQTTSQMEANYADLAELAKAHNIRAIFSSVLPVYNYTPQSQDFFAQRPMERILALNKWLKDYCDKNNLIYLDYFSEVVDDKGMLKRDLADDGLHPNKAGFAVMAPLAQKAIEKALQ